MTSITASEMARRLHAQMRKRLGEAAYRESRRRIAVSGTPEQRSERARQAVLARWAKPGARKKTGRKPQIPPPEP